MSDKRMIHVFNEMIVKPGRDVDTAELHFINGGVSATFFCAQQAHHAAHAINNYDQLIEDNKQLREILANYVRLVRNDSSEDFLYRFNEIEELLNK